MRRWARVVRAVVLALASWSIALQTGCAQAPIAPTIHQLEPRVDAIAGRTLIVPLDWEGGINPDIPLRARLGGGEDLPAELFWISVSAAEGEGRQSWLEPCGVWTATPRDAATRPSRLGAWAAVIELPEDAHGRDVWILDHRLNVQWVRDDAAASVASPVREDVRHAPHLHWLIAPDVGSPTRRWRHRLISRGLIAGDAGAPDERFADPVIEALAQQTEDRWRIGLWSLARSEPALASDLLSVLTAVVDVGGVGVPAWPTDDTDLTALVRDLLDGGMTSHRRGERVRAWLARQASGGAWVIDDAGLRDGLTGSPMTLLGVVNLSPRAVVAGVDSPTGQGASPLGPAQSREMGLAWQDAGIEHVRIRLGQGVFQVGIANCKAPAVPPGLTARPMFPDWTMDTWRNAAPMTGGGSQRALVYRSELAGTTGETHPWRVLLRAEDRDEVGHIRVWVGPRSAPTAVVRIDADGSVTSEGEGRGLPGGAPRVSMARGGPDDGAGWFCDLAMPRSWVGEDGTLLLGLEWVDASGLRRAWPRPMFPWQVEPGRLLIDTSAWRSLSEPLMGDAADARSQRTPP